MGSPYSDNSGSFVPTSTVGALMLCLRGLPRVERPGRADVVGGEVDIRCLNRHSNLHGRRVDITKLTEHPHALFQFHQRDDERQGPARHLRRVMHHEAEDRAFTAGDDVVGRRSLSCQMAGTGGCCRLPSGRFCSRSSCALTPSQKNLVSLDSEGRIMALASRSSGTAAGRVLRLARLEFEYAPVHLGDILVADPPHDVLVDEPALAETGLLRTRRRRPSPRRC